MMKPLKYLFCLLASFIFMGSLSTFGSEADNPMEKQGIVGNQPLYVIDGVAVNAGKVKIDGHTISYFIGHTIHKAVIKDMDMLKDADATAIYGAKGANGAFVITTKKLQK